jgi:hypothetical protein
MPTSILYVLQNLNGVHFTRIICYFVNNYELKACACTGFLAFTDESGRGENFEIT